MTRHEVGRWASALGVLLVVVACASAPASSPGPSLVSLDPTGPGPTDEPQPTPTPAIREVVHGWPDTGENAAGLYSWDGSRCAGPFCAVGFMHNGYGSGNVDMYITALAANPIPEDDATAATVAGHDAAYRRVGDRIEEWVVVIEAVTIGITLMAEPGTSPADLAEAHAIVASMRAEPDAGNGHGFRLVFRLTTDDWDSG